jgi:uncharacterized lipoprotein YmbA
MKPQPTQESSSMQPFKALQAVCEAAARPAVRTAAALAVLVAAGCATPSPPAQLYQLRSEPPAAVAAPSPAPLGPSLQLLGASVPELLERDAILVSQGLSGVVALSGHRWAEPLRDAVPRLLRQDLALWLGVPQVWASQLPAGVGVQRQLRIELLTLQADAGRSAVVLQARWTLSDPRGVAPAVTRSESVSAPTQGSDVDSVVAAHRVALWRLAERVAAGIRERAAP